MTLNVNTITSYLLGYMDQRYDGPREFLAAYVKSKYVREDSSEAEKVYDEVYGSDSIIGYPDYFCLAMVVYTIAHWSEDDGDIIKFFRGCSDSAWGECSKYIMERNKRLRAAA